MARYTGPNCKMCRREGCKLYLKGEVSVKNELTSFLSGCSHTHSVYYVVKTALKKDKEVGTGDTVHLLCELVVMSELTFEYAVVTSCLLLLTKLLAVFSDLLASRAVLTGSGASVVKCTLAVGATLALEIELAAFSAAFFTVRTCVSSHFTYTSL